MTVETNTTFTEDTTSERVGQTTFLNSDEEHDYTQNTLIALGNSIQTLIENGVNLNDIAILVRKNKNIPPIADYFDKELHIPVVSDEAFRLDASIAVCMLIDALRYLSNPNDLIAATSLASTYQQQIILHGQDDMDFLNECLKDEIPNNDDKIEYQNKKYTVKTNKNKRFIRIINTDKCEFIEGKKINVQIVLDENQILVGFPLIMTGF